MKKTLLAGVAALLMATSAVHADWNARFLLPGVPIPEEMLGDWCLLDSKEDGVDYYVRPEDEKKKAVTRMLSQFVQMVGTQCGIIVLLLK